MKGETVGLIGRNGAGKSTLLKVMAGIIGADDGNIETCAESISLLSLNLGFEPNLSGRDNAILNGMLLGFSKTQVQEKLLDIIDFSELSGSIDRPIKTYSSGMLARLAFSISLQMSPDIILIDEVLSVGDLSFQNKSLSAMKDKITSEQTVVFVSHDIELVKELCDQVIWLEGGLIKEQGDSDIVIEKYLNYFG
jgi:lipopolysaccharide transport system ATP-binding protein